MKFTRTLIATAFFLIILVIVYYVHVKFFNVNVILYAAISDVILTTLIAATLLWKLSFFRVLSTFEKSQLIVIWLLSGYSLAISVPTVIDRSLSFYILEKIDQRGGAIRQDAFETIFTKEYIKEYRLIDVRFTEQLESGTIFIDNGCVKLTSKGKTIINFSRYFRQHWLPKNRLLMGSYTDVLTDPFQNSDMNVSYTCK